ncbi:LuxR C-terminal-related transcriptional regulator [Nonomuraea africana]|uniref:LuxR C-terminal-related transcriptional regulator n=1 Tax=Nonomuraea africana TaxID=46171 RepID=UPI0033FCD593
MAVIEVTDLTKRYAGQTVLDRVSFSVEEGEIFGILGPNGTGKTTTVECVEGLRRPDGGSISVLGLDPIKDGRRLRELIGVQLQHTQLPENIKVWEALDLYASFYANPRDWRELLDQWGLADKRDARFGKLSGSPSVATRLLSQVRTPVDPLSAREREILELIAQGTTNREAAARLFISEATVKTHVLHIYTKLGVNDRAAAVAVAYQRGLLS